MEEDYPFLRGGHMKRQSFLQREEKLLKFIDFD